ncbi:MAG: molecular chaperone HtpG [Myxococcales bacterium]|nr:molecular chaperone HtpG [Myxococcales bacterium]
MTEKQTMHFETETQQLLELMIHSLYSNKEVFLRELISNASDALDKLRFAAVADPTLMPDGFEGEIRLIPDADARTLTIVDNGIGMSREDVVANIGTIARSGTQELMKSLAQNKAEGAPTELIGQFGVGFYSCFMAADKVTLTTRKAGEAGATIWEYGGGDQYEIRNGERDTAGTTIVMHLKAADADNGLEDFTQEWVLRRIVKKYSDFVRYPIKLKVSREEGEEGDKKTVVSNETLNSMKAIWRQSDKDVTDEERAEFYKHIAHDWTAPLAHIHMSAEGRTEYKALMFVPSHAPWDLFSAQYKRGLQLYVRNVKIMDHCEDLLPDWLRFLRGVVDAQDLPLNVSREILQNDRQIATIRNALAKKSIDVFKGLKDKDEAKYLELYKEFGPLLKEGVANDPTHRDKLLPLLLFASSNDPEKSTTLAEYVTRMKPEQNEIYYLAGEARDVVAHSPHLEAFLKKGFEVLFFVDPIDEFMVESIPEFEGKALKSVGKGEVALGTDEDKKNLEAQQESFADLVAALQKELDADIKEVRVSNRLTESPVCLVSDEHNMSPHIERLMRQNKMKVPTHKRILELNPDHPVIAKIKADFEADKDSADISETAALLYGQALLLESSPLPDPVAFARRVAKLMG